jgi:radical SAM/Cys-rich protein
MSIKQKTKSLKATGNSLTDVYYQLEVLNDKSRVDDNFTLFRDKIKEAGVDHILPTSLEIFQINIGKLCNQTCAHCHVDAGPDRKEEQMSKENLQKCLYLIAKIPTIHTVDITGGAPEMNINFRWFVEELHKIGKRVINRCNLTIIVANKKYHHLPQFFKDNNVHVVSSLPYFSQSRTDSQRGDGVFEDSIKALKMLNEVGYGIDPDLKLDLVYNPSGAFLPGSQESLENEFKRQLKRKYDISFHNLLCITNLPVSRFLDYLLESGNYEEYMQKLLEAFNPSTIEGLMCRNTISVSWDGYLYDCDFNQMLDLKVAAKGQHLDDFDIEGLNNRTIIIDQHCYGCTAGAGSSCGGEIA